MKAHTTSAWLCAAGTCKAMTDRQIVQFCKAGIQTTEVNSIGIYHYKIPEVVNNLPTSTIIVESGNKVGIVCLQALVLLSYYI